MLAAVDDHASTRTGSQVPSTARCRSRALRRSNRHAMFVARPENGLLAFALTPFLRRHSDHELPSRPGSAPHTSIRRLAMLGLHLLSRKAVRFGIADGSVAADAAGCEHKICGHMYAAKRSRNVVI